MDSKHAQVSEYIKRLHEIAATSDEETGIALSEIADALAADEELVRRETLEFLNSLPVRTSLGDAIRALVGKIESKANDTDSKGQNVLP